MKRIAMVVAVVAIAACSKGDKSAATDTTVAGGMVAPSTDSMGGAMTNGSSSSGSAMGGAASGGMDSSSMKSDNKTGGAMGGDSAGMGGTHGTKGSTGGTQNQTQSGMTNSSGKSTLGPNVTKLSPTSGQPVVRDGDTLKKAKTPPR